MKDFKDKALTKAKRIFLVFYHSWICKCLVIAFGMELLLEILGRRSIVDGCLFMVFSPFVFLYNVSIVFFTLLFALFIRKRVFALVVICALWLVCGIVNFVVLGYRVTPFAAIDVLMAQDALSMIDVYFAKWQQIMILLLILLGVAALVFLFLKTPKFVGDLKIKLTMLACVVSWIVIMLMTKFSVAHNIISDDFANLGMAYKDYGFAYCFTNSIIDNGISKPEDYSEQEIELIKNKADAVKTSGVEKTPNIIIIQLESFFDPRTVKGLEVSENPLPNFTKYKEEYPSGYFTVPAFGAGTANTEFEVLTGLKSSYFGAGEYPYKTTVNETPVEGLCSIFNSKGYSSYAIHNNKGSFYDRFNVYDEMGFDAFISAEYMYDLEYTYTNWAKDVTLPNDIMKCLDDTEDDKDFVYVISLQGHGRYPEEDDSCEDHVQITYEDEEYEKQFHYYINQIYEMDQMIADLKDRLDKKGEDYVLVLYGDHLPTLGLTSQSLTEGNEFQTEYVIINNIGIKLEDEDIASYELSTKLLKALNMEPGYAQKIQQCDKGNQELLDHDLTLYAYDMLFGDKYIYNGNEPFPETEMRYGVDEIKVIEVKNVEEHIVVSGENFNMYSKVFLEDEQLETVYVDRNTLLVEETNAKAGEEYMVGQVDKSHHLRSTTNSIVFK